MQHTEMSDTWSTAFDADIPRDIVRQAEAGHSAQGFILGDGRIAVTARRLLETLGFDPADDLRGLSFESFWYPPERPAVLAALRRARAGEETQVDLDLSYIQDREEVCTVSLVPAGSAGIVMMTVSR